MTKEQRDVLDFSVNMGVYESVDEADRAAGKAGAGLREMNNNLLYRGTYQEARDIICTVVEKETGVAPLARPTGEKDADGSDILEVYEKDAIYVKRALATSGKTVEQLQSAVSAACDAANEGSGLAADIKGRERKAPQPKKLAAKYATSAKQILASGKLDDVNSKYIGKYADGKNFTPTGDEAKDVEALGWLLKEAEAGFLTAQNPLAKMGVA